MNNIKETNGWNEWSRHVLAEQKRLNECFEKLATKVEEIRIEIAMLKVKASLWGGITGIIVSLLTIYLKILFSNQIGIQTK